MSAPLKVGGYVSPWAPDRSANFQFRVTDPYTVTRDKNCTHPVQSYVSGTTTWDSDPREWGGTICTICGKVLVFGEIDQATGEPRG